MCHRLGKGHFDYSNRNDNVRDASGKLRRNWNGSRVITRVYGYNALNAVCDLRDIYNGGVQWTENLRMTPAKSKRLERMYRCQSDNRAKGPLFGKYWAMRRRDHQFRNNYTVNPR